MSHAPHLRITQKEVAKEAGVSHSTVSLALRGHSGIPSSTRRRIEAIARRLGYTPDPMLKALSSYRRLQKPAAFQANLGWLNAYPQAPEKFDHEDFRSYFLSAKARAAELGFGLDVFNLVEYEAKQGFLERVLKARNIRGLIVGPLQNPFAHINLDWSLYSAVRLGYSMRDTVLHTVMNSQYRSAYTAVENLVRLGYRRIGYIGFNDFRCGGHFLGGYLSACEQSGTEPVPTLKMDADAPGYSGNAGWQGVRRWLKSVKPDAVLAPDYLIPVFETWGYSVPGVLGVASLAVNGTTQAISGINQNASGVGQAAVDLLVSLLEKGETGIPASPMHLLVDGWWNPGRTTREISKGVAGKRPVGLIQMIK